MTMDRKQAMILDCYEEVREASLLMLQAARESRWEALVAAERRCATHIARLQACGDDATLLDPQAKKRTHDIIRAILAHDAEIRELTQPWLRQLEAHLGTSRLSRKVAAAYRS
jgi:flagellar protein FliT